MKTPGHCSDGVRIVGLRLSLRWKFRGDMSWNRKLVPLSSMGTIMRDLGLIYSNEGEHSRDCSAAEDSKIKHTV